MIKGFERVQFLEPEAQGRFQWGPALEAGLIAGVVLLIIPRGSPWSSLSFFSFVLMGRAVPAGIGMPLPLVCLLHLAVAEVYGIIISLFVSQVTQAKAIATGGLLGLALYLINLATVSLAFPRWQGNEGGVLVSHVVFGLIAGGAYRGLLRRKSVPAKNQ